MRGADSPLTPRGHFSPTSSLASPPGGFTPAPPTAPHHPGKLRFSEGTGGASTRTPRKTDRSRVRAEPWRQWDGQLTVTWTWSCCGAESWISEEEALAIPGCAGPTAEAAKEAAREARIEKHRSERERVRRRKAMGLPPSATDEAVLQAERAYQDAVSRAKEKRRQVQAIRNEEELAEAETRRVEAAARIQAQQRGKLARRQVLNMKTVSAVETDAEAQ